MTYKLYGIMNKSGENCFLGSFINKKRALSAVSSKVNPSIYPVFCITTSERKHSIILSLDSGYTRLGTLLVSSSCIQNAAKYEENAVKRPVFIDPINNSEDGEIYWTNTGFFA
jgi:uncharacterized protein YaaR (DUF327 family)